MKSTLTLFLLFFINLTFGQTERTNAQLPKIQTTPINVLTKAKGYSLNENGLWFSAQNKIPFPNETQLEIDNFVSYDFRDIKINDTLYVLFMKKYNTGWHTYPALMEGWNSTISAEWFVLNKNEFGNLKFINDSINLIKIKSIYHGWIDNAPLHRKWNNTTYISDIQKEISKQIIKGESDETSLALHIAPYKSKNIVRFNFYSLSDRNSVWMISNEYEPKDPKGKYSFDVLKIYGSDKLFNYCYFETDFISFNKLLSLNIN